ncbi:MAG: hypothetical protein R2724_04390 [Bryobacterales bacterium]
MRLTPPEASLHTGGRAAPPRALRPIQLDGGERKTVDARYRLLADGSVGFALGGYDRQRALVIDPVLVYAGYLGGPRTSTPPSKSTHRAKAYVVRATRSLDFPTTSAVLSPAGGRCGSSLVAQTCFDVFAAKLSSDGSRVQWATYYGGLGDDRRRRHPRRRWFALHRRHDRLSRLPCPPGTARASSTDATRPSDAFVLRIGPDGARAFSRRSSAAPKQTTASESPSATRARPTSSVTPSRATCRSPPG